MWNPPPKSLRGILRDPLEVTYGGVFQIPSGAIADLSYKYDILPTEVASRVLLQNAS